jgi:Zn-dependent protease with chaperone function
MSPDSYAFTGTLAPARVSTAYRLGLVVVTAAMLVLPAVYLSLIALAGALVWWHLAHNSWLLSGRGGGGFWRLLTYLGPAIAGVVLMFFMVKPVFARPAKVRDPLPLRDDDESALFRFIEEICRQVGAPIPGRVQVDCQVNASASFMRGPFGLFRRHLVLTIGMPLAAGLTIRQFGGVLAHEFGHFAQGGGMRLTAIVRGLNAWLWRVVHERDAWDDKLEAWSEKGDWRLAIILMLARASIACSRWILKYLMMAGHGISCFMLRQMEFDADSYEVKLAGTPAFAETSARLRELNVGASVGYEDLRNGWLRRTLPSNLPGFLLERTGRLPEDLVKRVREIPEQKTGVFDTHPCDADRVRAAEAAASPGVMSGGDVPATLLFRDFAALSQDATRHHYEHDLGLDLDSATFVTTDDALRESKNREAGMRALEAFFGETLSAFRPIRVNLAALEGSGEAALIEGLRSARDEMARRARMATEYYRQLESVERRLDNALGAQELIAAGWERVDPTAFELKDGTLDGARDGAAQASAQLRKLSEVLALYENAAGRRIACAVSLLTTPTGPAPGRLDLTTRESLSDQTPPLVDALNALAGAMPALNELRRLKVFEVLLEHNRSSSKSQEGVNAQARQIDRRAQIERGRAIAALSATPDPLPEAGPQKLTRTLGLEGALLVDAMDVVSRAVNLNMVVLGRLTSIALEVEAALVACPR